MSALSLNSLIPNYGNMDITQTATKTPIIERNHFSGPSGGSGYHRRHHEYSGHSSSHGGGGKKSIALTALTLLSFLFFLNILQNCLQEHMDQMNPQVIIMQARLKAAREAEAEKRKGETDVPIYPNSSTLDIDNKEPRRASNSAPVVQSQPAKQKYNYKFDSKLTQIPVKLKTVKTP